MITCEFKFKRTENHNFTIRTNMSQHVEFFHSLIFLVLIISKDLFGVAIVCNLKMQNLITNWNVDTSKECTETSNSGQCLQYFS